MKKVFLCLASSFILFNCTETLANASQDSPIKWYVAGEFGTAETKTEFNHLLTQNMIDAEVVEYDDSDNAWTINLGYQFNPYIAVEMGYIDLGQRSANLKGSTTDLAGYYSRIEKVHPLSVQGVTANIVASWPITDTMVLSGKVGYLDWKSDYKSYVESQQVGSNKEKGQDIWYGGSISYRFTSQWHSSLNYARIKSDNDKNDLISFGVKYYF